MNYFDLSQLGSGDHSALTSQKEWGSGESNNPLEQHTLSAVNLFRQQFKNLVGRDPTQDELGSFVNNAYSPTAGAGSLGYGDLSGLSQNYIQNTFPTDVTQHQQDLQTNSLNSTQTQVQNLVNSLNQKTQDYLTSPDAQAQIKGKLNNSGMLNSGAYSQTLAGLLAQGANQNEASALQGVSVPALSNIQGLSGVPYSQATTQGQNAIGNLEGIQEFNMQAQLAQMLANSGGSSGTTNALGTAFAGLNSGGNILSGIGNYKRGKSG